MARTIPTTEPNVATAGDSWEWDVKRLVTDYPSATWTLTYRLSGPSPKTLEADAAADGTFEIRVPAAQTKNLQPGTYELHGFVTSGSNRFTVYASSLVVDPDPATRAAFTHHAEKTLAILKAALEGRLTADVESYQVEGRAVNKIPAAELRRLRGLYAAEVRRLRYPDRAMRGIGVRFG